MAVPVAPNNMAPVSDAGQGPKHQFVKSPSLGSGSGGPVPVAEVLQGGVVGTAYSETISAQGGTPPYSFAVTSGSLPAGLSLAGSTGIVSGTPSTAATSTFTVTVTDAFSATGSQLFSITVAASGGGAGGVRSYVFIG